MSKRRIFFVLLTVLAALLLISMLWDLSRPPLLAQMAPPLERGDLPLLQPSDSVPAPPAPLSSDEVFANLRTGREMEWRQAESEDTGAEFPVAAAWSLRVSSPHARLDDAMSSVQLLRGQGFHPYVRRQGEGAGLQYAVYLGPWVSLERLRQVRARLLQVQAVKYEVIEMVRYVPPSALADHSGVDSETEKTR